MAKKDQTNEANRTQEAGADGGAANATVATQPRTASGPTVARATPGRIVLVYGPDQYERPRPAIVLLERADRRVDVNIELHGELDGRLAAGGISGLAGTTLQLVPVFEYMTELQRNERIRLIGEGADIQPYWAEFPSRV